MSRKTSGHFVCSNGVLSEGLVAVDGLEDDSGSLDKGSIVGGEVSGSASKEGEDAC